MTINGRNIKYGRNRHQIDLIADLLKISKLHHNPKYTIQIKPDFDNSTDIENAR